MLECIRMYTYSNKNSSKFKYWVVQILELELLQTNIVKVFRNKTWGLFLYFLPRREQTEVSDTTTKYSTSYLKFPEFQPVFWYIQVPTLVRTVLAKLLFIVRTQF